MDDDELSNILLGLALGAVSVVLVQRLQERRERRDQEWVDAMCWRLRKLRGDQ